MAASPSVERTISQRRRQGRREPLTPEQTLANLREDNPNANAAELRAIAQQHILDKTDFEDEDIRLFTLLYVDEGMRRLIKDPRPAPTPNPERAAQTAQHLETIKRADRKRIEAEVEQELNIRLLEWQTTYGKALGDCTGAECGRLSRRMGDFFFELEKRLNRSETVRAHMTEAELQAIAQTHRLIGEKATR